MRHDLLLLRGYGWAALECVYVDYRFGKFLRSLLRQVVSDATSDEAVFVLAREFFAIGCVDGMRRTVRVPFHCDCRHCNHRTRGQSLLQFVVLRLALRQADSPAVIMNHNVHVVRILKRCSGTIQGAIVEVPPRRSELPNELRKVASILVVTRTPAVRREIELIPPGQFGLRWQRSLVGGLAANQITAHGY